MRIVILGSSPDVSIFINNYILHSLIVRKYVYVLAREAQFGRAELWRCLGCKFKSYLEQLKVNIKNFFIIKGSDGSGKHE